MINEEKLPFKSVNIICYMCFYICDKLNGFLVVMKRDTNKDDIEE